MRARNFPCVGKCPPGVLHGPSLASAVPPHYARRTGRTRGYRLPNVASFGHLYGRTANIKTVVLSAFIRFVVRSGDLPVH